MVPIAQEKILRAFGSLGHSQVTMTAKDIDLLTEEVYKEALYKLRYELKGRLLNTTSPGSNPNERVEQPVARKSTQDLANELRMPKATCLPGFREFEADLDLERKLAFFCHANVKHHNKL